MLPIRNISYLLPMCCSFGGKCKNSPKTGMGCSTPLTSFQSWCEILQSRIKSNSFVEIGRCTNYLQKVIRELVTSDWFFVIRNNSGVQIFRNDEKVRQRHLPKMYTLVVTMNWNRFRKIFRIRFCIFHNRSELSQCLKYIVFMLMP